MVASNVTVNRRFGFRIGLSVAEHVSHLRDTRQKAVSAT